MRGTRVRQTFFPDSTFLKHLLTGFAPAIIRVSKMSTGKQLVRGKSGMRMIAVSESERCPFLLEEPHWTDDTQV